MKKFKYFILGFVISALIFSTLSAFADDILNVKINKLPIYINNIKKDIESYDINGYTFVKLADIAKIFDNEYEVNFNQTNDKIEIKKENRLINNLQDKKQINIENPKLESYIFKIVGKNNEGKKENIQHFKIYTKDKFTIYKINEIEYISLEEIDNKIKNNNYMISYNPYEHILRIRYKTGKIKKSLKNPLSTLINYKPNNLHETCIEYNYFKTNILPLIRE